MIAHINIRDKCSQIDELHHIIDDNDIDIIGIGESILSDATSYNALLLDDNSFFRETVWVMEGESVSLFAITMS